MKDTRWAEPRRAVAGPITLLEKLEATVASAMVLILPLLFYIDNSSYGNTKTAFFMVSTAALMALWGAQAARAGRMHVRLPTLLWPALGLLAVIAASIIGATVPLASLQGMGILACFVLFFLWVVNRASGVVGMRLLLCSGVLAALIASGYGLLQYVAVLPGHPQEPNGGEQAMISSFGNKNFLAEYLIAWVFAGALLTRSLRARWARWGVATCTAVCAVAVLLANSTGALVGIAVGAGVAILSGWLVARRRRATVVALALAALAILTTGAQAPFPAALPGSLAQLAEDQSVRTRLWDWSIALEMWKASPWTGVGLGHYDIRFFDFKARFLASDAGQAVTEHFRKTSHVHNDYLEFLAETGLLGLAGLAVFVGMLLAGAVRQLRHAPSRRWQLLTLYGGLAATMADGLVNFPFHLPGSALGFALLLGLTQSPRFSADGRGLALSGRTLAATLALGALALGALITFTARDWQADVYLTRGNRLLDQGLYRQAGEQYQRSLALDWQPDEVYFRLGGVHYQLGEYDLAEADYLRSQGPFLVEDTYWNLAAVKIKQAAYSEARDYLNKLLALGPRPELRAQATETLTKLDDALRSP